MPKLTALAVALLTVMSIAPKSEAMTATVSPVSVAQPAKNLQAQLIIKIGGNSDRDEYRRHDDYRRQDDYRRLEEAKEAERRRREYYAQRRYERARYHRERDEYRRGDYHRDYRRDDYRDYRYGR